VRAIHLILFLLEINTPCLLAGDFNCVFLETRGLAVLHSTSIRACRMIHFALPSFEFG